MRKLWNAFKYLAPVTPLYWMKKHYMDSSTEQQDMEQDLTPQLQTHTYKIFLTPDVSQFSDLKIFAFDAEILGKEVVAYLDTTLGRHITTRFNDGEISIQLLDLVRGHDVYLIKSFENKNIDDGIMELILAVSCMKKSGAEKVTAIVPFFPYSTTTSAVSEINQGRDFHTCFAADIVKMLEAVGCDQVVTLNSLIANPKGFCQRSTFLNIDAPQLAVPYLIHTKLQNPVIVGSQVTQNYLRNATKLRNSFKLFGYDCQFGFFNDVNYIGENIKGRDVLLYNDLLRTGNSTKKHVKLLRKMGARYIYVYGFHGLCKNQTFDQLIKSLPIEQLIMTNTIFHANENKKIRTISVAKLIAQIISILHEQKSFSAYRSERELLKYAFLQKIKSLNDDYKSVTIDNSFDQTVQEYKDGVNNQEDSTK